MEVRSRGSASKFPGLCGLRTPQVSLCDLSEGPLLNSVWLRDAPAITSFLQVLHVVGHSSRKGSRVQGHHVLPSLTCRVGNHPISNSNFGPATLLGFSSCYCKTPGRLNLVSSLYAPESLDNLEMVPSSYLVVFFTQGSVCWTFI